MDFAPYNAFNISSDGRLSKLISPITIETPHDPHYDNLNKPRRAEAQALWDTGATHCSISKRVIEGLGLQADGFLRIVHARGAETVPTYTVSFQLPNKISFHDIQVTQFLSISKEFDVIIGMEIITQGDLAVTSFKGNTLLSFRTPSKRRIDFVKGDYQE